MAHLAAANMLHRKTRTAVSIFGVGLQIATVMLLVGLASGTLDGIGSRLGSVGADVIFQPPDASLILGATHSVMPVGLAEEIRTKVSVREITPVLNRQISQINGQPESINLWAVDYPSYARLSGGLALVAGRPLQKPGDLVLDTILAKKLDLQVGKRFEMLGRPFEIVGISRAGSGGRMLARLHDLQEANETPDMASFFLVKGPANGDAGELVLRLQEAMPGYKATAIAQVSATLQQSTVGLRQFKTALTGLAVVLSFIVVLLAMYTAIIERTREIGILRAMGATQAQVVRLVMEESALICLAGIGAGLLLAVLGRLALESLYPSQEVHFTGEWTLAACLLGFAGGLLGSLYPALRAARMDPLVALNFE